jgi:hypothetical protein
LHTPQLIVVCSDEIARLLKVIQHKLVWQIALGVASMAIPNWTEDPTIPRQ